VRLRRAIEQVGLLVKDDFAVDPHRSPYPGLLYFDEPDAAAYVGREAETSDALDRILAMARFRRRGFLLIAGSSGAGKSSLLRAGIVPRLRRNPDRWIVRGPLRPSNGVAYLREVLRDSPPPGDAIDVCSIDQFEEALDGGSDEGSTEFLKIFAEAAVSAPSLIFVATIRSDFLGLFQTNERVRNLEFQLMPIGLLPRERFPEVIERPASLYGIYFEPGFQRIVAEAEHAEALPLVAFTLSQMWNKTGGGRTLTFANYEHVGGIQGAIAAAARTAGLDLPQAEDAPPVLRSTFARLVDFGESGQLIRRRALWSEFPDRVRNGLEPFVKARLLVSTGEEGGGVEVAHEALFRIWPDFADWIESNRVLLQWRRRLDARMAEHVASRNEDSLLSGEVLKEALQVIAEYRTDLSADELQFVESSARAADRRKECEQLEELHTQLQVRREQWIASNRSPKLLLAGPSLTEATALLGDAAIAVSNDERSYIQFSEAHASRLEARRRFRKSALRWSLRGALAAPAVFAIGFFLQQIWVHSDALILHEIRTEARNRITESPAWFRLALSAGLTADAKTAVNALPTNAPPT
jgi:hypothetical protein